MSPIELWPGYSFNGVELTIPISRIHGLTDDEAHPTQGDFRALLFSLCSTLQTKWNKTPSDERPTDLRVRPTSHYTSSLAPRAIKKTYSFEFQRDSLLDGPDVIEEPEA